MNTRIVMMVGLVLFFAACSGQGEKAVPEDAEKPVVEQKAAEPKKAAPVEEAAVTGQDAQFLGQVSETIKQFQKTDPGMKEFFNDARGYVVFPTVAKGGAGIGAARGKGLAYEEGKLVGEVKLTQITIGAQLGGQTYSEVLFLENKETMDSLKQSNFGLSAQVSATAAATGASANAKYKEGVAVFTMAKGGLMYEASVGGQKFKFLPPEK
jgi:lipid-binding SYLF domain-containing protein